VKQQKKVTNIYTEMAQQQVKKHHTGKREKLFFPRNECKEEKTKLFFGENRE
jgi:hypothetical protein